MAYTLTNLYQAVRQHVGRSPHHFVEVANDTDLLAHINTMRKEWAERTRCFYTEKEVFTTATDTSLYDLQSTAIFVRSFIEIESITMNNSVLCNFQGKPGPVTQHQLFEMSSQHQTAASGTPRWWGYHTPRSIKVFPAASGVIANTFVAGWYYPADLTAGSDDLLIADGEFRAFSKWVASGIVNPTRDEADAARYQWLREEGELIIKNLKAHYETQKARGQAMGTRHIGANARRLG